MTALSALRRTKIVATLGPASAAETEIADLVAAGVDVVRINSSHGDAETWTSWIERVRRVAERDGKHVGVLLDLQGPRIRVGRLSMPMNLETGAEVVFAPADVASGVEIPTTHEGLARDVEPGSTILLDDGRLMVEVTLVRGGRVHGVVREGGLLTSNKGMNLPGSTVSAPTLTDTDRAHLAVALEHGVDLVGISFVRRAEDIDEVRRLVPAGVGLIAKIEKAAAIDDLSRILDAADGLMVARGDLGVELPFEQVPLAQKRLIASANQRARPAITATQMLESMVRNSRPTRAEASDVANAILDGTDAVMLSGETAIGEHPVDAVRAMARICVEVERSVLGSGRPHRRREDIRPGGDRHSVADAIANATTVAAEQLQAAVIACFTKSGFTARQISAHRPTIPIVGLSTERSTCRALSLVWGVVPLLVRDAPSYEEMLGEARDLLLAHGFAKLGDRIAVTAGVPFHQPGTTNLLKVEVV